MEVPLLHLAYHLSKLTYPFHLLLTSSITPMSHAPSQYVIPQSLISPNQSTSQHSTYPLPLLIIMLLTLTHTFFVMLFLMPLQSLLSLLSSLSKTHLPESVSTNSTSESTSPHYIPQNTHSMNTNGKRKRIVDHCKTNDTMLR